MSTIFDPLGIEQIINENAEGGGSMADDDIRAYCEKEMGLCALKKLSRGRKCCLHLLCPGIASISVCT